MLEVEIFRYYPGRDAAPYLQKFTVPLDKGVTVLGVLDYIRKNMDESLAYKSFCTNQHCGECALMLNEKPVLACHAIITTDHIVLKPLARFPVIRDLVVDTEGILRQQWADLPPLDGTRRSRALLTDDEQDTVFKAGLCIECLICQSSCPLSGEREAAAVPGFSVALSQYLLRVDTKEEMETLLLKAVQHGILQCTACKNCSKNCPKEIDPFGVIAIITKLIIKNTNTPVDNPNLL